MNLCDIFIVINNSIKCNLLHYKSYENLKICIYKIYILLYKIMFNVSYIISIYLCGELLTFYNAIYSIRFYIKSMLNFTIIFNDLFNSFCINLYMNIQHN